jgi:hypothetical protein
MPLGTSAGMNAGLRREVEDRSRPDGGCSRRWSAADRPGLAVEDVDGRRSRVKCTRSSQK